MTTMSALVSSCRRGLVRVARTQPAQAVLHSVYAAQFGVARGRPRFVEFANWLATRHPLNPDQRRASVAATDQLFFDLVLALRPELMIEAGAKDAGMAARVRAAVPTIRAVAFEANPYTYRRFRKRHGADASGVDYRNLALDETAGEVTFQVRTDPDGTPHSDGQGSLLDKTGDDGYGRLAVTVPATTLDEFFADERGRPCAVWVDVEGATMQVLRGGPQLLADTQVLIVEVEERAIWQGQGQRGDVVGLLQQHGLAPIARDFQSRFQHNIVFVREERRREPAVRAALRAARATRRGQSATTSTGSGAGAVAAASISASS